MKKTNKRLPDFYPLEYDLDIVGTMTLENGEVIEDVEMSGDLSKYYTDSFQDIEAMSDEEEAEYNCFTVVDEEEVVYTKEESESLITEEIDFYYVCYKLPILNVSSIEWDYLFNTIYSYLEKRDECDDYYYVLSSLARSTLISSLFEGWKQITYKNFVDNIDNLDISFTEDERNKLKLVLYNRPGSKKILSFSDYKNRKK